MLRCVIFLIFLIQVQAITDNSPRIVIIGAGASGIAAASRLLQNGFENVTILEAENRIGGRIYTTKFADHWIDLGGQWVRGEEDNVVYELAWRLGVIEHSRGEKKIKFLSSSGSSLTETTRNDLMEFYYNITDAEPSDDYSGQSIGEYYRLKFNERFDLHPEITKDQRKSLLEMFDLLKMTTEAGDSWLNISVNRDNIGCKGDQAMNWKDEGYNMIFDILMKKFPDSARELPVKNKTILNVEVSQIDYNVPHGVIRVFTTSGKEFEAEHVIVTTSLGVLKADHETLFNPPLTEMKIDAIKGLQFGHVAKIYLSYNTAWWESGSFELFYFHWTDRDKKEYENDSEKSWLLSIIYVATVEHKPRVLCCFLAGPHAREMEYLAEDLVFSQIREMFHRFFGKSYKLTDPSAMLRSKWFINKHFRGSGSYRSLDTEVLGVGAADLQEPIMHDGSPLVLFAGEATSTKHSATVNGAIGSGWREANRLIKLYGRQKSTKRRVNVPEFSTLATLVVP